MLTIRLKKISSNKKLMYSIVISSHQAATTGNKFIEKIGFYRPTEDKWHNKYVYLNVDRLLFWLNNGAKFHESVFIIIKPLVINALSK